MSSSSVVLIVVIPSCVFGIEVSCYYCLRDVAKLVEVGYVISWYCGYVYVDNVYVLCVSGADPDG